MRWQLLALLAAACSAGNAAAEGLPRLVERGDSTQLLVHDEPFLILGGELGNSSASSREYMAPVWSRLAAMNVNTVLAPVYWELVEPREGEFDFSSIEWLIDDARAADLKLVLLWFATWKNSMSSHAPGWVKLDQARFPRVQDEVGRSHEILTPFSDENLAADRRAFVALLRFLKDYDAKRHTVIMVQVENEIGMLPVARDHHPAANAAYADDVPAVLTDYLETRRDRLVPEFRARWNRETIGDWEALFGEGAQTEEIFMAWHFARFANAVTEAGKAVYPLPMFVNAALNRPGREPGTGYPSGGPLPHLMDVWKAAAPTIDFLSPDFYTPRFRHWNDLYTRQGDPLFIPEHRFDGSAAAKAAFAVGHYEALGFAPFSVETGGDAQVEALTRMYDVLGQLAPVIAEQRGRGRIEGLLFDGGARETVVEFGDYRFTARHDYTLGWSPAAAEPDWPAAGAVIVQTGPDGFWVGGTGVVITFERTDSDTARAGILAVEEGRFLDGEWHPGRRLNGDQIHQGRHLRIPMHDYGIQRLRLYRYD